MNGDRLTAVVLGAGNRASVYAKANVRIVAVAEPDDARREAFASAHGVPAENRFRCWTELLARGRMADFAMNATMDAMHLPTSLAAMEAGYDLLLEKPIATSLADVRKIIDTAKALERRVMVCHVLRYAPVYSRIRALIDEGAIGQVVSIHTHENVSYHHMATGFVRGRWRRIAETTPMIVAKCCHDTDLLAWLAGADPVRVSSFGSLGHFRAENAPEGAPEYCLDGCPAARTCPYEAKDLYVRRGLWRHHIFLVGGLDDAQKTEHLRRSQYGRCVYRCDNDQPDRQVVNVEFANGATASHTMVGLTSGKPGRSIHVSGTRGEIAGEIERPEVVLRTWLGEERAVSASGVEDGDEPAGDGHGGADARFCRAFVDYFKGLSESRTEIRHSLNGHVIAFEAERSRVEGRTIEL